MLKDIIRKLLPKLYNQVRKYYAFKVLKKGYLYDIKRYFNNSDYFFHNSEKRYMMRIIHRYHPVEKGLTMPEMRLGFGKDNISNLLKDCIEYKNKYLSYSLANETPGYQQYKHALRVLLEYRDVHNEVKFPLDTSFVKSLNYLINGDNIIGCSQINFTKKDYFDKIDSPFNEFSKSRHSLRNFEGKIETEVLHKAINLAQTTPSACNRQPSRVHIIINKDLIKKVLDLQGGNRGFGYLADKVLIITAELAGYRSITERNYSFVDGGLYAMNLLYALHFYKIGTCALNWCYSKEKDTQLRKLIDIPESQTVIIMIACGGVPEEFKVTLSKKNNFETIIHEHF